MRFFRIRQTEPPLASEKIMDRLNGASGPSRLLRWARFGVASLWVGVLLPSTALIVLSVWHGDGPLPRGSLLAAGCLLVGAFAVEWPWRKPGALLAASATRLVIVGALLVWLQVDLNVHVAARNASEVEAADRVTMIGDTQITEYASGVATMSREMAALLRDVGLPILVLVWLCALPGLRAAWNAGELTGD